MTASLARINILIVDDSVHVRRLLGAMLRAMGAARISEVKSHHQAMSALERGQFDIALVDWMLDDSSEVSGLDLVRDIRRSASEDLKFMPIIMITGHTERENIIEARDAGVNEFLAKPFTAKTLFSRINALVDQPRPFVKTRSFFGPDRRRRNEGPQQDAGERRFYSLR
jgi:DNA-binding response OmpR family regulator